MTSVFSALSFERQWCYTNGMFCCLSVSLKGCSRKPCTAVSFAGLHPLCHHARIVHIRSPRRFSGCLRAISAQSCNLDWQWIAYNQPQKVILDGQKRPMGWSAGKARWVHWLGKAKAYTQHSFDQSRWQVCMIKSCAVDSDTPQPPVHAQYPEGSD